MDELQQQTAAGQSECLHSELSYKRLESGRFVWPPIVDGKMVLTPAQLTPAHRGDGLAADSCRGRATKTHGGWLRKMPA